MSDAERISAGHASHLDEYEQCARRFLERRLGPLRVTDRPGGPPGVHDFEVMLSSGSRAVIEVTSEVNSGRLGQHAAARRRYAGLRLESGRTWVVGLAEDARLADIPTAALDGLVRELDLTGRHGVTEISPTDDPLVQQLRGLRIESIHGYAAAPGREGTVVVRPGTFGGVGWQGPQIDTWLAGLLPSDRGQSKIAKLGRANAEQFHLAVVLDTFTEAGIGIPLGLSTRHEAGAAPYVLPSVEPPTPLTHLWLLPIASVEALVWTRGAGWATSP